MAKSIEKTNYWWDLQTDNRFGSYIEGYEKIALNKSIEILPQTEEKIILDFGCGSGYWSLYLHKQGKVRLRTIGIDINNEAAKIYRDRIPSSTCILTSTENECLPLRNESLDLIIAFQAPFINDWFLKEVHRVLKTNGLFVGTILNKSSWRGVLQKIKSSVFKKENPFKVSFNEYRKKLETEGVELIFSQGFGWIPVPSRHNNSLLIPIFGLLEKVLFLGSIKALSPNLVFLLKKL